MPKIELNQIISPEINIRDQDEFNKLKESIKTFGLLHPIIIQEPSPYKIIAGKKRFLAVKDLEYISVECTIFNEDNKSYEISLHENLRRDNLPWYEIVVLEQELHELRISQYGKKNPKGGRPTVGNTLWSQNDTAKELGLALGTFSQDMQLAKALRR